MDSVICLISLTHVHAHTHNHANSINIHSNTCIHTYAHTYIRTHTPSFSNALIISNTTHTHAHTHTNITVAALSPVRASPGQLPSHPPLAIKKQGTAAREPDSVCPCRASSACVWSSPVSGTLRAQLNPAPLPPRYVSLHKPFQISYCHGTEGGGVLP